jgi:hypothetical protein
MSGIKGNKFPRNKNWNKMVVDRNPARDDKNMGF